VGALASPMGDWHELDLSSRSRWWRAVVVDGYGGRDTQMVVSWTGHVRAFTDSGSFAGVNELDPTSYRPVGGLLWLVDATNPDGTAIDPWTWAQTVREMDCAVVHSGSFFGLCAGGDQPEEESAWRLAYAHILLGYTPPSALFSSPSAEDWEIGARVIGDYPARRVRRGVLAAITEERRTLTGTASAIRNTWRA
jgi:hypothetical protein